MGAPPTRITATDFVTPPELRDRQLAVDAAGRIGGVRLELRAAGAETRLGTCYQQVPLRVLPPLGYARGQPALLYLLNPTAGLMDGDAQLVEIIAGPRSRALVAGQSATRIHPSVHGFSTQQWNVRVAAGAVLVVLPGPAIPFRDCRYYQRVAIDLAPGAGFIWGDIWVAGRYARGADSERFQFTTLIQELTVRRDDRLVFRDRFCWQGPWTEEDAAWHFANAAACASLFVTGSVPGELLAASASVATASFPTACGDTCVRWGGSSEAVTARLVGVALRAAALLEGTAADSWLFSHQLAAGHWFAPGLRIGPDDPGG